MKLHGQFTQELYDYFDKRMGSLGTEFNHATVGEIVRMTRMGIMPEGAVNLEAEAPTIGERAAVAKPSQFAFGAASQKELEGVNANLVRVTHLALSYCSQDFCVYDGIRTFKEQAQHVKDGTSKTMQSKHLDGLAVDLVPWANGKPTWDWNLIWPIAYAMDRAATELGFADRITWGGAWDRKLSDFGGDSAAYKKVVDEYKARHPGKDFIDGPHFEILP